MYTGGPGLKYKALGDVLITSTFGPLLVSFAFLAQAGSTGWSPVLASLPLAAHTEAILHANNARDVREDTAAGMKTVASIIGPSASAALYAALLATPLASALVQAWGASAIAALPLVASPMAAALLSDFRAGRMYDLPKRCAAPAGTGPS